MKNVRKHAPEGAQYYSFTHDCYYREAGNRIEMFASYEWVTTDISVSSMRDMIDENLTYRIDISRFEIFVTILKMAAIGFAVGLFVHFVGATQ